MTAAWALEIGATDKIVLLALADHANDDGYCWPGNASLCKKCGLSERAVRLALGALEKGGHITRHFVKGKSTSYHIHPGTTCPRHDMPPAPRAETPAPRAPKSSVTVIDTPNGVSKERAKAEALPDWLPKEAWAGFVEMRRKVRKPMTPRAQSLILGKLAALRDAGHDPAAVLDQSTMNNWQGLFEVKGHGNVGNMGGRIGQGAGGGKQPLRGSRTMDFLRSVQRELEDERGDEGGDGGVSYSLALPGCG